MFRDNSPSPNRTTFTNMNTRQNRNSGSNPAVVTDNHLFRKFNSIPPGLNTGLMRGSQNAHIGAEGHTVTDDN